MQYKLLKDFPYIHGEREDITVIPAGTIGEFDDHWYRFSFKTIYGNDMLGILKSIVENRSDWFEQIPAMETNEPYYYINESFYVNETTFSNAEHEQARIYAKNYFPTSKYEIDDVEKFATALRVMFDKVHSN